MYTDRQTNIFETIVNSISVGIQICKYDEYFTITYINKGFTDITGYSKEEIFTIFKNKHTSLLVPNNISETIQELTRQLSENNSYSVEYQIKRKDGKVILVLDKGTFIENPNNNKEQFIQCVISDITEQKKKEEALIISDKRYEIAMNFSDITIFDYDIINKQIVHNWTDVDIYNLPKKMQNPAEALIASGIINPLSHRDFRRLYDEIENGEPFAEAKIQTTDQNGDTRIIELNLTTIYDSNHKPVRAVGVKKDITETIALQREKEYGNTFVSNKIFTYEANITKNIITNYNDTWASELGISNISSFSDLIFTLCSTVIDPKCFNTFSDQMSIKSMINSFNEGKKIFAFEYRRINKDGKPCWLKETINMIKDEITNDILIRAYSIDVTESKEKEIKIFEEQKYYETMLAKSIVIYEINVTKNLCISGYDDWEKLFGIKTVPTYSQMIAAFYEKAVHPEDRKLFYSLFVRENLLKSYADGNIVLHCEYRRPNASGEFFWVRCTMHLFAEPHKGDIRAYSYIEDINVIKQKELDLIYKAEHDLLTGFYNKIVTEERINDFLNTSVAKIASHAFFMVDIDYFKSINDTFGHIFGDAVLSQISSKIRYLFRDDDILGRIGGDEFVILMKNVQSDTVVSNKAQELCNCIKETFNNKDTQCKISASIGISFYNEDGTTYEALYTHSDSALYVSKKIGRNTFTIYDNAMSIVTSSRKGILQNALIEPKIFEENISDYVFNILYESNNKSVAINSVLELIAKHYKVSRVYIFEDSYDKKYMNNTFEWCNEGIAPEMYNLQNVPYSIFDNYVGNFNGDGIFYLPDISYADDSMKTILEPQKVKSMLQFSIQKNGEFKGYIGFDECSSVRVPTKKELSELKIISNILAVFVLEMRAIENIEEAKNFALSIVNGLNSYAYVCDPNNYKVLFINEHTRELVPNAKIGDSCYTAFWNRKTPCTNCPMQSLLMDKTISNYSMDIFNTQLLIWIKATASWIDWIDGQKICLVDSVDISEYKK